MGLTRGGGVRVGDGHPDLAVVVRSHRLLHSWLSIAFGKVGVFWIGGG